MVQQQSPGAQHNPSGPEVAPSKASLSERATLARPPKSVLGVLRSEQSWFTTSINDRLPHEVIAIILEIGSYSLPCLIPRPPLAIHCSDKSTITSQSFLVTCSLVCRQWSVIVNSLLLRDLRISKGKYAHSLSQILATSASDNVPRTFWITSTSTGNSSVTKILGQCPNIRRFCWSAVEGYSQYLYLYPPRLLSACTSLRSLTLAQLRIVPSEFNVELPQLVELHIADCVFIGFDPNSSVNSILPYSPLKRFSVTFPDVDTYLRVVDRGPESFRPPFRSTQPVRALLFANKAHMEEFTFFTRLDLTHPMEYSPYSPSIFDRGLEDSALERIHIPMACLWPAFHLPRLDWPLNYPGAFSKCLNIKSFSLPFKLQHLSLVQQSNEVPTAQDTFEQRQHYTTDEREAKAYPEDDFWLSYEKAIEIAITGLQHLRCLDVPQAVLRRQTAGPRPGESFVDLSRGGTIRLGNSERRNWLVQLGLQA
ncbi:hypothetical protein T439DRAFT_325509 [Meredithblackwellia eburnea MCA 4105]